MRNFRYNGVTTNAERLGGAVMRVKVTLRCNECKQRNYNTMKNKKNTPDKLELNKYSADCLPALELRAALLRGAKSEKAHKKKALFHR